MVAEPAPFVELHLGVAGLEGDHLCADRSGVGDRNAEHAAEDQATSRDATRVLPALANPRAGAH
jgi:hypothetical protein